VADPATIRHLRDAMIASAIEACQDPGFTFMWQVTMTARGRLPHG
jgi:hypothetical protein